ncbi:MAG TPA: hypothetical protein VGO93_14690 [Candidatus Xenobia bacterium]|jgi:hypothetical protein
MMRIVFYTSPPGASIFLATPGRETWAGHSGDWIVVTPSQLTARYGLVYTIRAPGYFPIMQRVPRFSFEHTDTVRYPDKGAIELTPVIRISLHRGPRTVALVGTVVIGVLAVFLSWRRVQMAVRSARALSSSDRHDRT